ncbi:MAG: LLM class flavin-dependent oxidoreductase [Deltaproteobacteria bacterium]|nr:LLM class flavin-dependent oxidoreductase [Deltaproteobacteria bacterium]
MSGVASASIALSLSLPPGPRTLEYARLAEELGYCRLWLYDSPLLYGDVWVALARVAEATSRLGVGPGVLVPGLRHVATNAAAIATLETLAPGRVAVAVGTGFTARRLLGKPPLSWKRVEAYVVALRALLHGEAVEIDGELVRMIHPDGYAPPRPIRTPILVAASGPRGSEIARAIGDGVMTFAAPPSGFAWCAVVQSGTVLDPGESFTSSRVFDALAPGIALIYHSVYEAAGAGVDQLPGGAAWRAAIDREPARTRHLVLHEGHCVAPPARERALLDPDLGAMTFSGSASELAGRVAGLVAAGATELVYSPAGADVPRELRAMACAVGTAGC